MNTASDHTTGAGRPRLGGRRRTVARLAAVQALYQLELNPALAAEAVIREFANYRLGQEIEGDQLAEADPAFFADIVRGVAADQERLDADISVALVDDWPLAAARTRCCAQSCAPAPGNCCIGPTCRPARQLASTPRSPTPFLPGKSRRSPTACSIDWAAACDRPICSGDGRGSRFRKSGAGRVRAHQPLLCPTRGTGRPWAARRCRADRLPRRISAGDDRRRDRRRRAFPRRRSAGSRRQKAAASEPIGSGGDGRAAAALSADDGIADIARDRLGRGVCPRARRRPAALWRNIARRRFGFHARSGGAVADGDRRGRGRC